MSHTISPSPGVMLRHELEALQKNWIWYLALGIGLIVLGTIALGASILTTFVTVAFLGVLFLLAGVTQGLGAFWARRWSGVVLQLLSGILYVVLGLLMLRRPGMAAAALTLLIACFLMVGGLFRVVAALSLRFPHWGWALLGGAVELALGLMIWSEWPGSSLMIIGIFVGVEMIFGGWFWVVLALSLRRLSTVLAPAEVR